MDPFAQLKQTFLEECDELLDALEGRLVALQDGSGSTDDVNGAFRAIHSIKGGAGAFGFQSLVDISHVFEAALDHLRSGRLSLEDAPFPLFMRSADAVAGLVAAAREERAVPAPADLIDELKAVGVAKPAAAAAPAAPAPVRVAAEAVADDNGWDAAAPAEAEAPPARMRVRVEPHADLFRRAVEPRALFGGLETFGLVVVRTLTDKVPPLAELDPLDCHLAFEVEIDTKATQEQIAQALELQLTAEEFRFGGTDAGSGETGWDDDDGWDETPAPEAAAGDWDAAPAGAPTLAEIAAEFGATDGDWEAAAPVAAAPEPAIPQAPLFFTPNAPPAIAQPAAMPPATVAPVAPPVPETPATAPAPVVAPATRSTPQPASSKARQVGSIRVDLDRIDKLMNLVGEIVITQSMLDQRLLSLSAAEAAEVADGLQILGRQTRELQEAVMSVRAQPVRNVFQRMPRLVRELATSLGKEARLVVRGEETEVDKTIIEELSDPLTHMIRNAMDHGLETTEERAAAGKPAEGVITLTAEQRGGRIVITVGDDGRGINREKLLAKARARGLVPADVRPAPEEIDALIFHPGLSTAEAVTAVSGRGVGMDVVKQNVEALGGRIHLVSEPGRGSRFTLLLPLTLAVMDGMIIRAGGERFVLPLSSIVETIQFAGTRVESLPNGQEFLRLRDQLSPLVRLGPALGLRSSGTEQIIVMTETDRGERVGLAVEEIVNQQQVVVKSLEASYGRVPGASAATILGDGLVALIVDVDSIPMHAAPRGGQPVFNRSAA